MFEWLSAKMVWAIVGIAGGLARFFNEVMIKDNDVNFSWPAMIFTALSSGFFGYMGGETALLLGYENMTFFMAGLVGFMGAEGMKWIITKFTAR